MNAHYIRAIRVGAALATLLLVCPAEAQPRGPSLDLIQVDPLERIFPDREPAPASLVLHIPRNSQAAFQFAVHSAEPGECSLSVSLTPGAKGISSTLCELQFVPVEANNNGGSKTQAGVKPPTEWLDAFVRQAPFEVAEVLREHAAVSLTPGRWSAVLVDVKVAESAPPGEYDGMLTVMQGSLSARVRFQFVVHPTSVPAEPALSTTYWFFPDPVNVSYGNPPEWWNERHWRLIKESGATLRAFGQDHIYTPLIDGRHPLIRVTRRRDGAYTFDYAQFDRWVETFSALGFRTFEGVHVGGGHSIAVPPMAHRGGVWVWDERQGKNVPIFDRPKDAEPWLAFLPTFYQSLYAHLKEKGWLGLYVQCQLDEPRDPAEYKRLADLARTYLPGIKTKDAINARPALFSPLVDIHVFSVISLAGLPDLARERRAKGQDVWFYHCCSPYPPHPNRHLDERLTDSRLYPWLAYLLNADGYLYWAANHYRGADPYKTSVGPVPNGSQTPGHPPGDNWFFYPTNEGLIPSLRMIAFRDGLVDHTLLTLLAEKDRAAADAIMQGVARSLTDYARTPDEYHRARQRLLEALE